MAISIVSTTIVTGTLNTPVTLAPAGNYSIQEMQIIIAAVNITTAGSVWEFSGNLSSGGTIFHVIDAVATTTPNGFQPLNLSQGKTFANPLILAKNAPILFTPTVATNLNATSAIISFNFSGFTKN